MRKHAKLRAQVECMLRLLSWRFALKLKPCAFCTNLPVHDENMPPAIDVTDLQVTPNDCPLGKERLSFVKTPIRPVKSCAHVYFR